jgi:putative ABC transport system permease protein
MRALRDTLFVGDPFVLLLYGSFALLALVLAAVGIYGVIAFRVSQRQHETGVRIALGARGTSVAGLILGEGSVLSLTGLGIGGIGAYFVGKAMQSTLYGVQGTDLLVITAVALILFMTALFACYLPARNAAAIDPMRALRVD